MACSSGSIYSEPESSLSSRAGVSCLVVAVDRAEESSSELLALDDTTVVVVFPERVTRAGTSTYGTAFFALGDCAMTGGVTAAGEGTLA